MGWNIATKFHFLNLVLKANKFRDATDAEALYSRTVYLDIWVVPMSPMNRGDWRAMHRVAKSQTGQKRLSMHACNEYLTDSKCR